MSSYKARISLSMFLFKEKLWGQGKEKSIILIDFDLYNRDIFARERQNHESGKGTGM